MHCEGLDGYISEEAETLICREKPQQVLYYHGKKAGSIYSRLEEVYHDLSIPPGEKMPDYGEEGRETSYTYDGQGREKTRTNGEGETEYRLEHDALGRITAYTDGETKNFVYRNGMPVSELDADKNPVRGIYTGK